jgi:hypothetical protein
MPQHGPVKFEHLLLLLLGGAICLVPLRLRDGAPGERRERELGVIPQVEPPLVPAAVRAGQRHWVRRPMFLISVINANDRIS